MEKRQLFLLCSAYFKKELEKLAPILDNLETILQSLQGCSFNFYMKTNSITMCYRIEYGSDLIAL